MNAALSRKQLEWFLRQQHAYQTAYGLRDAGEKEYIKAEGCRLRTSRRAQKIAAARLFYELAEKIWPLGRPKPTFAEAMRVAA